jgi:hypothetical protein
MRDLNSFDFTNVKTFIQAAFQKSVDLGAFQSVGFSVESFMKRVMDNGFEPTFTYMKSQSNNFERITYSTAYRRKSSSGKVAKTSIIYYRFDTEFEAREEGVKQVYSGNFFRLCWPVHLMNKKDIWFDLDTGDIWLTYRHPSDVHENHKKVTMEELLNLFYVETMGSLHYIVNKKTNVGMTKKFFFELPDETIRSHVSLCDMIEV